MTFDEVLDQVREILQQRGRVTYRSLKLRYQLDDELLAGVTDELISAERVAVDEDGKVLVWIGAAQVSSSTFRVPRPSQPLTPNLQSLAERRQLTVMFCDLVGSTALSEQLDPEELRDVVQTYQGTCTEVIWRYDGYIAQHLGDGLLVYFGYPAAHEDDAARAVRAGLEIIGAIREQVSGNGGQGRRPPLQVRIGIHTGLVVIGEIGSSTKREMLALGETPNLAARVQGVAEPDTVVISQATYRLVHGLFEAQDLGPQDLKGISTPMPVYRINGESVAQSRFEVSVQKGLTPLVGRAEELALLQRRWAQAKDGAGQAVLLSGEPGIGKSRLMQEFKEQLEHAGMTRIEFHCSPYHQNSAFYPIIDHLQRLLQFTREDTPAVKLAKLQQLLARYRFPQTDTVPLLAALLSLPHPEGYPPITVSPQKQKEKTQAALIAWLVEEAEQAAVFCVWEDLHWADPSTLEVLTLLLDQAPTTQMLTLLTSRPEFSSPWGSRSYLTQLTLSRLGHAQVREMVRHVAEQAARASTGSARTGNSSLSNSDSVRPELVEGRPVLPDTLIEAVVTRTDGVPLFVEELTKTVVETIGAQSDVSSLQMGVPSTLQDALMARLDRLGPAKEIAQVGATLGREFHYELLYIVANKDEGSLQQGLRQLVETELIYQRGLPPQAIYLFKHALIQDTAYQSLLKSHRQQLHQQTAQVLEAQFSDTKETQPELLAHHYTEAGLIVQAIPYWQKAGERAIQRSAYVEAISHLSRGLEVLKALPDTLERTQQELTLQLALNNALVAVKGYTAPEVEKIALRAQALCQQLGEIPQIFPMLFRLTVFYMVRGEVQTTRELAEQLLRLAHSVHDQYLLSLAHWTLGCALYSLGKLISARLHLEQAIALYDPQLHARLTVHTVDPRVNCLSYTSWTLWHLGYPEQGLQRSQEAVAIAVQLAHPFGLALALGRAAVSHLLRREEQLARDRAEAVMSMSTEQGFPFWLAVGRMVRGWALTEQGQVEEGIGQMRQSQMSFLAPSVLAEAYGKVGQVEEGLAVLANALAFADKTGLRVNEAELYRLKGELTLQSQVESHKSKVEEAEACFLKAIEIAQKQQAKSLELRATASLARLWQKQGKIDAARTMLADVYNWFTEGFDTKDLQEAKALLNELSH